MAFRLFVVQFLCSSIVALAQPESTLYLDTFDEHISEVAFRDSLATYKYLSVYDKSVNINRLLKREIYGRLENWEIFKEQIKVYDSSIKHDEFIYINYSLTSEQRVNQRKAKRIRKRFTPYFADIPTKILFLGQYVDKNNRLRNEDYGKNINNLFCPQCSRDMYYQVIITPDGFYYFYLGEFTFNQRIVKPLQRLYEEYYSRKS